MNTTAVPPKSYCNCLALEKGLDPVGHADSFEDAILIETPLPWKRDMTQTAGALPQPIIDLLALWLKAYYAGEGYPHRLLSIAPDPLYSRENYRRVMHYTRPTGAFSQFNKVEYHVPVDELGTLAWALYQDRTALPRFEAYRIANADTTRDILVCTHGSVDAACAKFGYPLYKHLRDTYAVDQLRVWRVSHFGGHVFAPTFMEMPSGHFWAYVENAQAAQIIRREGDVAALRRHYRGWAGLRDGFQQAAECALWQRHGWAWFDTPKRGITRIQEEQANDPTWAEVQIAYTSPGDSSELSAELRVEVSHTIETLTTTGEDHTYAYPQYRVTRMETASGDAARSSE